MVEAMTRADKRRLLLYCLLLIVLTTLPYVAGFQSANEDWTFSGLLIGVEDGNSYLAKMLRGAAGDWLFRTPYTTIEQPGVLIFLPYILLGKLAGGQALRLQLVGLFHTFRVLALIFHVWATFRFVAAFIQKPAARWWATVVATVGGGLGWLVLPLAGSEPWPLLPLSFISPETFGFLSILALPHLAMARGFMLLTFLQVLDDMRTGRYSIEGPLYSLLTFLFNPLAGVALVLVLAAFSLARLGLAAKDGTWRQWWRQTLIVLWSVVLATPYVLYLAVDYQRQAFLQAWSDQNLILSPHFGYYLLAFGLLLIPAILGWWTRSSERMTLELLFVGSWLVILPILPYLPVGVQRRLPEGGWVALTVAATWGFSRIGSRPLRRLTLALVSVLSLISPILLLWGMWRTALIPAEPAFIPDELKGALLELEHLASVDDALLAGYQASNLAPSFAPIRVPIGHGPESVNGPALQAEIEEFLAGSNSASSRNILRHVSADWILQQGQNGLSISGPWQAVYEVDGARLYQVLLDP